MQTKTITIPAHETWACLDDIINEIIRRSKEAEEIYDLDAKRALDDLACHLTTFL